MADEKDISDLHKEGTERGKVIPITDAARLADADSRRVRTERQLLDDGKLLCVREAQSVCTSGHYGIDADTGGIRPGFVWVFGADTNWGKSSMCVMMTDENLKRGKRVLMVSSEDSASLYGERLLCRRARVSASRMRDGRLEPSERDAVFAVVAQAPDKPVFLDAVGKSAEWAAAQVKRMIRLEGVSLVQFDYLQSFDNQKAQQDRRNSLTYIARVLTDAVKSEGAAGIIFSQITVSDVKKNPDKHSIRDSRDVSNAAEVVALGFCPEQGVKSRDGSWRVEPGERAVLLDKVKNGSSKRYHPMRWDKESACFDAVQDPETERLERAIGDTRDVWDN